MRISSLWTNTARPGRTLYAVQVALLNLMPTKIATETQFARLLGNTPLQVELTLLQTATYEAKNTSREHLLSYYQTFDQVCGRKFDGLVITGAPVELMEFGDVEYWDELCGIMEWSKTHVYSTLHICWSAQAALCYHYGIRKYTLPQKLFGVFPMRWSRIRSCSGDSTIYSWPPFAPRRSAGRT